MRSGHRPRVALVLAVTVLLSATSSMAQLRRIPAETTPLVDADGARAGSTIRVALKVALPDGFHVQSNQPRDPSLIATELNLEPPAGVVVEEVVFPQAHDFKQEGLPARAPSASTSGVVSAGIRRSWAMDEVALSRTVTARTRATRGR